LKKETPIPVEEMIKASVQYPTDMTTIWELSYMRKSVFLFNMIINFEESWYFDWVKVA
jgi:hypothetical protein